MRINQLHRGPLREEAGSSEAGGGGGAGSVLGSGEGAGSGAGAGGEIVIPDNFMEALPEDMRSNPALKDYKPGKEGLEAMVKTMIHGQTLIGKDRIALPGTDSTPEEKGAFYDSIGRPKVAGDYQLTVPEGLKNVQVDEAGLTKWKEVFHAQGLTNEQAQNLIAQYYTETDEGIGANNTASSVQEQEGINKLKDEWGDKFEQNTAIASGVVRKFGGEAAQKYLDESGLGNNSFLIGLFHNVGAAMLDDTAAGGSNDILITDGTRAKQEINSLKADKTFIASLTDKTSVGHKEAKSRWDDLHKVAFS